MDGWLFAPAGEVRTEYCVFWPAAVRLAIMYNLINYFKKIFLTAQNFKTAQQFSIL